MYCTGQCVYWSTVHCAVCALHPLCRQCIAHYAVHSVLHTMYTLCKYTVQCSVFCTQYVLFIVYCTLYWKVYLYSAFVCIAFAFQVFIYSICWTIILILFLCILSMQQCIQYQGLFTKPNLWQSLRKCQHFAFTPFSVLMYLVDWLLVDQNTNSAL